MYSHPFDNRTSRALMHISLILIDNPISFITLNIILLMMNFRDIKTDIVKYNETSSAAKADKNKYDIRVSQSAFNT